jgi:hypothetical protein
MTMITTQTRIHKLQSRYPFNEEELEILIRCHDQIEDNKDKQEDFLLRLALASPFSYYFLPGDELRDRVTWIEDHVLPMGFASQLRASISADAFVTYANEGEDKPLERFLEGVADTGRRGPREALRVLYALVCAFPCAEELMDLCFRLAIACDALTVPNLDKKACLKTVEGVEEAILPLVHSLTCACKGEQDITKKAFIEWAERTLPMFSSPLFTFVHRLIFHQMPYPEARLPYAKPLLESSSDIFNDSASPLLLSLSMVSSHFNEKMSRLYSSETDGRSFNRLEWALLGYDGPTLLVVKTDQNAVIGAFAQTPWKDSLNYYGSGDCFIFQLYPELKIRWPKGSHENFMYMHYGKLTRAVKLNGLPHGIGFGGSQLSKPRFFIPDSFENCSAEFMDTTFETGDILPESAREKFEINVMEVWGVGTEDLIAKALQERAEHREQTKETIRRARAVTDKTQFVKDLESGFTFSKLYEHKEDVRGRQEYRVDEAHGGYKIDQE